MEGSDRNPPAALPELDREFAAVVFTAGPGSASSFLDGHAGSSTLRRRVDALSVTGTHVAVLGSLPVAELDDRLRVRPRGPGRLLLAGCDGAQVAEVTSGGMQLLRQRAPAIDEDGGALATVLDQFESGGIGPGLLLVIGDFDGGGGCDAHVLVPRLQRAVVLSVGEGRSPLPAGVVQVGGGAAGLRSVLAEVLARRAACRVPSIDQDPAWVISEPSGNPHRQRVSESVLTLACGGVGTRGSVEENGPGSVPLTVTAGVYKGVGAEQQLAAAPHWTSVQFAPPPAADVRHLDLRTGVLLRVEQDADGVPVRTARIASQTTPGLMLMRVECAPQRMTAGPALHGAGTANALRGRNGVWRATTVGEANAAVHAVATQRERRGRRFHVLDRFAVYSPARQGSRRPNEPAGDGAALPRQLVEAADQLGFDRLLAENRAAWARRWDAVDVRIPADPATQLAARFALFQLWSHSGRHDELALGARGLTGPGYAGHVFWDADVFVLPALCSIDPAAARAIMTYRHSRLAAARARAAALGAPGARFPWESAATGEDVTPTQGRLGGRQVAVRTGSLEEHITADVAWAAAFCCEWTGRPLRPDAAEGELILETARYWAHRIRRDAAGAHIDAVTGPDEYHENVDDDAYTNVMARWNLRAAARLAGTAEAAAWRELADALVDGYDPGSGRYEQFSGYFGLHPLLVAEIATPPVAADVLLGPERLAASQVIKQPDVLMLHHMVPEETAPGSLAANLDFYDPRTAHGSSLSPAITAALLARAGRPDDALEMLRIALWLDLEDRTHMTAAGLHLATIGGVWQALLSGFAGARVRGGALLLDPRLPAAWPELEIRFLALNRRVRVHVDAAGLRVWSDGPLPVRLSGDREVRLPGGREVHLGALPPQGRQPERSLVEGGLR